MADEWVATAVVGGLLAAGALLARLRRVWLVWLIIPGLLVSAAWWGALPADALDLPRLLAAPAALVALALAQASLAERAGPHPRGAALYGAERASRGVSTATPSSTMSALLHQQALGMLSPLGSGAATLGWLFFPSQWLVFVVPPALATAAVTWRAPGPSSLPDGPWTARLMVAAVIGAITLTSGIGWLAGRGWGFLSTRVPWPLALVALVVVSQLLDPSGAAAFVAQVPWPPGAPADTGVLTLAAVGLRPDRWLRRTAALHGARSLGTALAPTLMTLAGWLAWWLLLRSMEQPATLH